MAHTPSNSTLPSSSAPLQQPRYAWSTQNLSFLAPAFMHEPHGTSNPMHQSPFPRHGYSASPTGNGEFLLFGGLVNGCLNNDIYSFNASDLSVKLLQTEGVPPSPRFGHASAFVKNVLVVWGGNTRNNPHGLNTEDVGLYFFSPETREWGRAIVTGPTPASRCGHSAAVVGARLYIFGGQTNTEFFDSVWSFNLNTLRNKTVWKLVMPINGIGPGKRSGHTCVPYGDRIIMFGGSDGKYLFNDTWSFNTATRQWTELNCIGNYAPAPREAHDAAIVNGVIYVFGGKDVNGHDLNRLAAFRISNQRWYKFKNVGQAPHSRAGHKMVADGTRVFVLQSESSVETWVDDPSVIHVLETKLIKYSETNKNVLSSPTDDSRPNISSDVIVKVKRGTIGRDGREVGYGFSNLEDAQISHPRVRHNIFSPQTQSSKEYRLDKRDPNDQLQRLLTQLEDLDLTVKIRVLRRKSCGGCADIYIGVTKDSGGGRVAVKRARFSGADDRLAFIKRVVREMRIWSLLIHENILPFKGFINEEGHNCPSMVTDWMENGSLRQFLQDNDKVDILFMMRGIAEGLSYLHSRNVVHGDLKAENVVVSSTGVPLIMDFGISHILISTTTVETATAANKGSLRWQARELLLDELSSGSEGAAHHTKESDIWAFGMTCLEGLTRKIPYAGYNDFRVGLELNERRLPKAPPDSAEWAPVKKALWDICRMCWQWERSERPLVDTLLVHLQSLSAS